MLQNKSKTFGFIQKKRYLYPFFAILSYIFIFAYKNYIDSINNKKDSVIFNKMLNREIEIKSSLINRKNIYRQLIKVIEVANNFNNGSSDIDLDLDFIHQNFRLKALFSAITLNKSPQTLGYLEKRGSPWLGFVKFCNVIRGEIEPKLGEFSFCNHLLLGKKDISEDEINQTSDNCTKNLNLNMRID